MKKTIYVRIGGENAGEIADRARIVSTWAQNTYSINAHIEPYGLSVEVSTPSASDQIAITAVAKRLKSYNVEHDNEYVVAISKTDPVVNARQHASNPWPGALAENQIMEAPRRTPGVTDGRVTGPPGQDHVPKSGRPQATEWGPLTPSLRRLLSLLVQADTPMLESLLPHRAKVSQRYAKKTLAAAAEKGLVTKSQRGNNNASYRITEAGLNAIPESIKPPKEGS